MGISYRQHNAGRDGNGAAPISTDGDDGDDGEVARVAFTAELRASLDARIKRFPNLKEEHWAAAALIDILEKDPAECSRIMAAMDAVEGDATVADGMRRRRVALENIEREVALNESASRNAALGAEKPAELKHVDGFALARKSAVDLMDLVTMRLAAKRVFAPTIDDYNYAASFIIHLGRQFASHTPSQHEAFDAEWNACLLAEMGASTPKADEPA